MVKGALTAGCQDHLGRLTVEYGQGLISPVLLHPACMSLRVSLPQGDLVQLWILSVIEAKLS